MIINEKEYELIKKIEEITITEYEVLKISEDTYFIKTDNIIPMLEDLKYEYDHKLEELEDIKNNDDEREFKTWN